MLTPSPPRIGRGPPRPSATFTRSSTRAESLPASGKPAPRPDPLPEPWGAAKYSWSGAAGADDQARRQARARIRRSQVHPEMTVSRTLPPTRFPIRPRESNVPSSAPAEPPPTAGERARRLALEGASARAASAAPVTEPRCPGPPRGERASRRRARLGDPAGGDRRPCQARRVRRRRPCGNSACRAMKIEARGGESPRRARPALSPKPCSRPSGSRGRRALSSATAIRRSAQSASRARSGQGLMAAQTRDGRSGDVDQAALHGQRERRASAPAHAWPIATQREAAAGPTSRPTPGRPRRCGARGQPCRCRCRRDRSRPAVALARARSASRPASSDRAGVGSSLFMAGLGPCCARGVLTASASSLRPRRGREVGGVEGNAELARDLGDRDLVDLAHHRGAAPARQLVCERRRCVENLELFISGAWAASKRTRRARVPSRSRA